MTVSASGRCITPHCRMARCCLRPECKALFAHGGISARIDATAVAQIATLWVSVPPRTAFEGVQELPAGHLMVLEGGKVRCTATGT